MSLRIRLACLLVAALPSCTQRLSEPVAQSAQAVGGVPIGNQRGVADVTDTLRIRLLDEAEPSTASFAVERVAGSGVYSMRSQLGVFELSGTQSEYRSGVVSPFTMMLWHQVFGRVAAAIGQVCTSQTVDLTLPDYVGGGPKPVVFKLTPEARTTILGACAAAPDEATRRADAGALWTLVMGHGGSLAAEKEAFLSLFAGETSPFLASPPAERVSNMVSAMLLNPHFLLAR